MLYANQMMHYYNCYASRTNVNDEFEYNLGIP